MGRVGGAEGVLDTRYHKLQGFVFVYRRQSRNVTVNLQSHSARNPPPLQSAPLRWSPEPAAVLGFVDLHEESSSRPLFAHMEGHSLVSAFRRQLRNLETFHFGRTDA